MKALLLVALLAAPGGDWVSLFDGRTVNGWLEVTGKPFPPDAWKVEDGCLKAVPGLPGFQDLRTVGTYRDFEFEFEWKIAPGGNSGVKYLLQKTDEWTRTNAAGLVGRHARARGLEYQLVDDDANADAAADPKNTAGALYGVLPPLKKAARKPGEFNHSRIVVVGNHVEQWLNGVKVIDCELDKTAVPRRPAESPICLQNHDSAVWFRNLRIRAR